MPPEEEGIRSGSNDGTERANPHKPSSDEDMVIEDKSQVNLLDRICLLGREKGSNIILLQSISPPSALFLKTDTKE